MGSAVWGALQGDGAGALFFARLTAGFSLGRFSGGGAFGGAGVQELLSGVYAGVFFVEGGRI